MLLFTDLNLILLALFTAPGLEVCLVRHHVYLHGHNEHGTRRVQTPLAPTGDPQHHLRARSHSSRQQARRRKLRETTTVRQQCRHPLCANFASNLQTDSYRNLHYVLLSQSPRYWLPSSQSLHSSDERLASIFSEAPRDQRYVTGCDLLVLDRIVLTIRRQEL